MVVDELVLLPSVGRVCRSPAAMVASMRGCARPHRLPESDDLPLAFHDLIAIAHAGAP